MGERDRDSDWVWELRRGGSPDTWSVHLVGRRTTAVYLFSEPYFTSVADALLFVASLQVQMKDDVAVQEASEIRWDPKIAHSKEATRKQIDWEASRRINVYRWEE